jgi:hypothetical protein
MFNGSGLKHIWEVISFGHYFDVFLVQPFQRFLCIMARFVIFVVFLDEFDHVGQTFGDINVSIDSVTVPMKGVETPASEIAHQTKTFGLNLPTALYFTTSGVFPTSSLQKLSIPVKVLCVHLKYISSSQSLFGHKHVCDEEIGIHKEFSRAGLAYTLEF